MNQKRVSQSVRKSGKFIKDNASVLARSTAKLLHALADLIENIEDPKRGAKCQD